MSLNEKMEKEVIEFFHFLIKCFIGFSVLCILLFLVFYFISHFYEGV